jgi:predicted GNAT family acetyltransferase
MNNLITKLGIHSIIDFYQTISIHRLKLTDALCFATGVNSPYLNVVFDSRKERYNSQKLINSVSNFFNELQVPWVWFIIPGSSHNDLLDNGLSLIDEAPAMYFDLQESFAINHSDEISFLELDPTDDLSQWILPINEGYQIEAGDHEYQKLNVTVSKREPNKLKHYIAFYKGKLAASGTLFLSDQSVMIHNIATKNSFLKRGIATALTHNIMKIAKNMGFQHCFLDSSESALNLYKRIGFKEYAKTLVYSKSV